MQNHTYTQEEILELHRCSHDVIYFTKKYVFKTDLLTPYQLHWLTSQQREILVVPGSGPERRSYRTSTMLARLLHASFFNNDRTYMYCAQNNPTVDSARKQFAAMVEAVPDWIRPGIRFNNRYGVEFDNRASVRFSSISYSTGRGLTISGVAVDNLNLVKPEMIDEFHASIVPCIQYVCGFIMKAW